MKPKAGEHLQCEKSDGDDDDDDDVEGCDYVDGDDNDDDGDHRGGGHGDDGDHNDAASAPLLLRPPQVASCTPSAAPSLGSAA